MKKIGLIICFLLISGRIAQAGDLDHFLLYGPSAASLAMGQANVATPQDAGAIHYNPALLYSIDDQFMITHYFPAEDKTKYDFFAFSSGDEDSALGFSGEQFKDTVNTQTMWCIGYAKRLRIFDIGASIKWLRYSTKVFNKSRFAADIGIAKQMIKKSETNRTIGLSYGVSIANVVQTTVSIQGLAKMPVIIRGGFALNTDEVYKRGHNDNILIETGFIIADSIISPAIGMQYTMPQNLKFRLGQSNKFSYGLGWEFDDIQLDYAYIPSSKHSVVNFIYTFGQGTGSTVQEPKQTTKQKIKRSKNKTVSVPEEDLRKVRNRALRIYDKYMRNAKDLTSHDLYEEARILLLKALPLTKENKNAYELLDVCEKVVQTKQISAFLMKANDVLIKDTEKALENYLSAYMISQDAGVYSVISELIRKNPGLKRKRDMFTNNNIAKFDLFLRSYDYEKAKNQIKLLKNLIERKRIEELNERLETSQNIYITRLIMKASEHLDMGEYQLAYKYFNIAYKLNDDRLIKEKINEIKEKYQISKQDKIYAEKLYLVMVYNYSTDENHIVNLAEIFKYDIYMDVKDLKYSIKKLERKMPKELQLNLN
jgi:tetratricopeptide (TPR) repeat protein